VRAHTIGLSNWFADFEREVSAARSWHKRALRLPKTSIRHGWPRINYRSRRTPPMTLLFTATLFWQGL
jgi:hypothetical protein